MWKPKYQSVCVHSYPYLMTRPLTHPNMTLDLIEVVPNHPLKEGDLDSETGNAILIPCNPTFDIPQPRTTPPTDLDRCDNLQNRLIKSEYETHLSSALHIGWSICRYKRLNGLRISCIPSRDTGPSSPRTAIWMTYISNTTLGSWRLAFPAPAGARQLQ
jgi:hypothetical protein